MKKKRWLSSEKTNNRTRKSSTAFIRQPPLARRAIACILYPELINLSFRCVNDGSETLLLSQYQRYALQWLCSTLIFLTFNENYFYRQQTFAILIGILASLFSLLLFPSLIFTSWLWRRHFIALLNEL